MSDIEDLEFRATSVDDKGVSDIDFQGEGLKVLCFFPGAFTKVCTEEMCQLRDSIGEIDDTEVKLIGVSVDPPGTLSEFSQEHDLNFELVSDQSRDIIEQYDVRTSLEDRGFEGVAKRAVFIVKDGEIIYREVMDNPFLMPDMDELEDKVREAIDNG